MILLITVFWNFNEKCSDFWMIRQKNSIFRMCSKIKFLISLLEDILKIHKKIVKIKCIQYFSWFLWNPSNLYCKIQWKIFDECVEPVRWVENTSSLFDSSDPKDLHCKKIPKKVIFKNYYKNSFKLIIFARINIRI